MRRLVTVVAVAMSLAVVVLAMTMAVEKKGIAKRDGRHSRWCLTPLQTFFFCVEVAVLIHRRHARHRHHLKAAVVVAKA